MATGRTTRSSVGRSALVMLIAVALLGAGFAYGYMTHRERIFPYWPIRDLALKLGHRDDVSFHLAHPRVVAANRAASERAARGEQAADAAGMDETRRRQLEALGYASGSLPAPDRPGVALHDPERARHGLNLYASGHAGEALLMDMDGNRLHRWEFDGAALWPDGPEGPGGRSPRRVMLLPEGDLLAIFEGRGIVQLDRDSRVRWKLANRAHHDFSRDAAGNIYVLTRTAQRIERISPGRLTLEDFVEVLDSGGRRLKRVSLLEAFERSRYARVLEYLLPVEDPFHTNSVKVLTNPDLPEPFRPGRVMLSIRELNTLAVLDLEREEIVWALNGQWHRQHEASVLDDGHILLFDNRGLGAHSRMLEIDPATQEVMWSYGGKPEDQFYSSACGTARRFDNGNTLITESDRGRAFEVTASGEIVWEFLSPHRAPHRDELVATLYEVVRVDAAQPWLKRP